MHIEATDLVTILLLIALEGLLSVDNAMVLAVLALGLPDDQRRKALRYGIIGAFVFRSLAVVLAVHLIQLTIVKLLGGAYLLWLPYRHFFGGANPHERCTAPKATPWLGLTAFWATVVRIELTDIVFAVDSIVAAVGMSNKTWVVLTGGILGIVAMRLAIGQLMTVVERFPPLVDGAFVIIAWVGVKLVLDFLHSAGYLAFELPKWLSPGLIAVIFAAALAYAIATGRAHRRKHTVEQEAANLLTDSDVDDRRQRGTGHDKRARHREPRDGG